MTRHDKEDEHTIGKRKCSFIHLEKKITSNKSKNQTSSDCISITTTPPLNVANQIHLFQYMVTVWMFSDHWVCHCQCDTFVLRFIRTSVSWWILTRLSTKSNYYIWLHFRFGLQTKLDPPSKDKKRKKNLPPRSSLCFSSRLWLAPTGGSRLRAGRKERLFSSFC